MGCDGGCKVRAARTKTGGAHAMNDTPHAHLTQRLYNTGPIGGIARVALCCVERRIRGEGCDEKDRQTAPAGANCLTPLLLFFCLFCGSRWAIGKIRVGDLVPCENMPRYQCKSPQGHQRLGTFIFWLLNFFFAAPSSLPSHSRTRARHGC